MSEKTEGVATFVIDVWMGTKKALTAAVALGLADAIRARSKL